MCAQAAGTPALLLLLPGSPAPAAPPAPPPPPAACRHLVDEAQAAMSGLTIKTSTQLLGQPPYNTFKRQALWEAQARPPARSQLLGAALPADPT
jgi:hypothetical protein